VWSTLIILVAKVIICVPDYYNVSGVTTALPCSRTGMLLGKPVKYR